MKNNKVNLLKTALSILGCLAGAVVIWLLVNL